MDSLGPTKIFGAVLATALGVMALREVGHQAFHVEAPEKPGFLVEIPEESAGGDAAEEQKGPVDFGRLLAAADPAAGEKVFAKCKSCHSIEAGGPNGTGPNLHGVYGEPAGAATHGFKFSAAMTGYGKTWSYQNLYEFLENPKGYVPGTAMAFAGLKKQEERIAMIAYLRSQSGTPGELPAPLPEGAAAPAGEAAPAAPPAAPPADAAATPSPEGAAAPASAPATPAAAPAPAPTAAPASAPAKSGG
jgi:cytochrome c